MKIEEFVRISPPVWPGKSLPVQPGDLSRFAPMGMGLAGPFPVRPWDDPFGPSPARYYGFQTPGPDPFLGAPVTEPAGGTVYFDAQPDPNDFRALFRLMGINDRQKQYAAFLGEAEDTERERYLTQLRIVSRSALLAYGALTSGESETFPEQPLSVGELLPKFIAHQEETWGLYNTFHLSGTMGGDGDWAKESLAFGLTVENSFHGIYRVWSRAWLVTK